MTKQEATPREVFGFGSSWALFEPTSIAIPEHLRDEIKPLPQQLIAMASQSDKKCETCKRPIYKSAIQVGKYYCWKCRRYFT